MNQKYVYVGCFIPYKLLQEKIHEIDCVHLERMIKDPHITFVYKPTEVDEKLFGEKIKIIITGYGNDGKNEGVKVRLESDNPQIDEMIRKIEVPHITLSVSRTGKPVATRYLSFSPIEEITLTGTYGGYDVNGNVVTE